MSSRRIESQIIECLLSLIRLLDNKDAATLRQVANSGECSLRQVLNQLQKSKLNAKYLTDIIMLVRKIKNKLPDVKSAGLSPMQKAFTRLSKNQILNILKNINTELRGTRRHTGPKTFKKIRRKAIQEEAARRREEEAERRRARDCRNNTDLGGVPFSVENPPIFRENDYCFSQNDLAGSKNTLIGKIEGIGGYLPTNLFLKNPYTNQKFKNLPVNNRMFELMYGINKGVRTQAENNELLGLLGISEHDYDRLEGAEFTVDLMSYLRTHPLIQQAYIRAADEIPIEGAYEMYDGNFETGFLPAEQLGQILAKMRNQNVDFILPGETSDRRTTSALLLDGNRLNIRGPDSDDEDMSFRMRSNEKHLDQKMLQELKLLQQEVSTINKHRISHLKSEHKRLEKRIEKGLPTSYDKYKKTANTRMKQRLKRVDKSLNVYEKATKKRSRKVSRKSSRKRRSVKRKVSRKRGSVKRKVSRKRRSVKRKVSRKRRSVKRKVSRKRRSVKRKVSRKRRSVKRKVSRKRRSVKRKSRKSSRKRRSAKKKR
jgi:hypothetical protein